MITSHYNEQQDIKMNSPQQNQEIKIQTFKYAPFGQMQEKREADPSSYNYNKSQCIDIEPILKSQGISQSDTPNKTKKTINRAEKNESQDEGSCSPQQQQKESTFRIKKMPQNQYADAQKIQKREKNMSKYLNEQNTNQGREDQMSGQVIIATTTTTTTKIIKNKSNIDFDLSNTLKQNQFNQEIVSSSTNSTHHFKRNSLVDVRNQAQQELLHYQQQLQSPQSNQQPTYNRRGSEVPPTFNGHHSRYKSVDIFQSNSNTNVLPLLQLGQNSPQAASNRLNLSNINYFTRDSLCNSPQIGNKSSFNNNRQQRNSNRMNFGDTLNSSYGIQKVNTPIKDILQMKLDQKQSIFFGGNSLELSNKNSPGSNQNSILHQNRQSQQNMIQNIKDRSPSQFQDEYLCNRRKSNSILNVKNTNSNPSTPQSLTPNNNLDNIESTSKKSNINSQFFTYRNTQFDIPKLNSPQSNEKNNEGVSDSEQLDSSRQHLPNTNKGEIKNRQYLGVDDQTQNNNNNIKSLMSFSNLADSTSLSYSNPQQIKKINMTGSMNIPQQPQNSLNMDLSQNDLASPPQNMQPITLTQINIKDYDAIKTTCLEMVQNCLFSDQFQSNQFEKAAHLPFQDQEKDIITFISLSLEEFSQELIMQSDKSTTSFLNFKDIDMPPQLSQSFNNISQIKWPQFHFKFHERFAQVFVDRIMVILEQNEFIRKKTMPIRRIISQNFKKYFCHRDFIKEIGGIHNITAILQQIIDQLELTNQGSRISNFLEEIKQFSLSLLEYDSFALVNLLNKHLIQSQQLQQQQQQQYQQQQLQKQLPQTNEETSNISTTQKSKEGSQSQNSFSSPKYQMVSPQQQQNGIKKEQGQNIQFSASQAKLAKMTGMRVKKGNTIQANSDSSALFSFKAGMFFEVKYAVYCSLSRQEFVSSKSIMKILESMEQLRYDYFRSSFGHEIALTYVEYANNILNLIPDSHIVLLLGSEVNASSSVNTINKKNYVFFFKSFCEHVLLLNTSTDKLRDFLTSSKINLNADTIYLLETHINYVIGAMKYIPTCQSRDIKDKFQRLKRVLKIGECTDFIYDNINSITEELQNHSTKSLTIAKQLSADQIKQIKDCFQFFCYLLESTISTASAYSHYDIHFAYSQLNLKDDSLLFWVKLLKRTLQKQNYKSTTILFIEQQLTDIINNKTLG